jgi:peptide/nickel transport system substrate-binding protein
MSAIRKAARTAACTSAVSALLLAGGLGIGHASADTLRIGLNEDVDTLDPHQGRTFGGRHVFATLCDKLFDIDAELNLVPQLATGYEVSDDSLAVTLSLREGVVFHDGAPFDAEAVRHNIERALTMPESARRGDIRAIESVEVVDSHTARLHLSEPFAPLLAQLADRAGMMVSPAAAEAMSPEALGSEPVCAGPYHFVERVVQDRIVLERFEDHWRADEFHFDRVVYLPVPDSTVRLNNLLAGQLDIIEQVATTDLPTLEDRADFDVASVTSLAHFHIQFNVAHGEKAAEPFGQDRRLRHALELAIDRDIINDVVFEGAFVPGNQPVAPGSRFYADSAPVPKRDLERARELVAESGIESPRLELIVNNTPIFVQVAQVVQSLAREAGIEIEVRPMEASTAAATTTAGDFTGFLTFWSGRVDPDGNIYTYFGCESAHNVGQYCNEEVERLINAARTTSDDAERARLYEEAAQIYLEDLPVLYLYHPVWFFGYSADLEGFEPVPDGLIRIHGVRRS